MKLDEPITTYIDGAGQVSSVMTPAHAAYFRALPQPVRDGLATTLRDLGPLTFVACDGVSGKNVRITDPVARICYYRAMAGPRLTYFTIWLTAADTAAHLRISGADEY